MVHRFSWNHLSLWSQRSIETMVISLMSYDISVNNRTYPLCNPNHLYDPWFKHLKHPQCCLQLIYCIYNSEVWGFQGYTGCEEIHFRSIRYLWWNWNTAGLFAVSMNDGRIHRRLLMWNTNTVRDFGQNIFTVYIRKQALNQCESWKKKINIGIIKDLVFQLFTAKEK